MKKLVLSAAIAAAIAGPATQAQELRVLVTIENLAPQRGTFQTPFWVGFHDGGFDLYDRNQPASLFFPSFPNALEALAEDGNTAPLTDEFALQSAGVDATLPGPNGPIAPGDVASGSFILDPLNPVHRYFSYASMVLPSNDFFVANGNPLAHEIFDAAGNWVAEPFFISGDQVLDAGTEINDEVPANTAFFGQQAANTGVTENGVVIGLAEGLQGFQPPAAGGILADPRFAAGDFLEPGYPVARISFAAAPVIDADLDWETSLDGGQEVPPTPTRATGVADYRLRDQGARLEYQHHFRFLSSITMAHLHLGAVGENGPVVASLLPPDFDARRARRNFGGELTSLDLTGPLAGQPLDALIAAIENGDIYVNIHSEDFPNGEIRGQLTPAGSN